jgi:hypothetical protein
MSTKTKDIEAEAKAKAEAEAKLSDPNEEVEYYAQLLPGRTQKDIFVCVNGDSLRLKRGMKHKIKRKFAEALENANEQTMSIYNTIDETKKKGEKPLAEM